MISIEDALTKASQALYAVAKRPRFEAEILLGFYLGLNRVQLVTKSQMQFDETGFFQLIEKRQQHYPIEYLTNEVSFYDTTLFIEEGVLIARPETEILVEKALELIKKEQLLKVAEIGVGSAAISVCLARHCKNLQITATDINPKALSVAQKNIDKHRVGHKIELVHTSLLEGIEEEFDLIVSNPPYIASDFALEKNVLYEPKEALFGGERGDELLFEIIALAQKKGVKYLICEMGYDQKKRLQEYFDTIKQCSYRFYKDLSGLDRGFILQLKPFYKE